MPKFTITIEQSVFETVELEIEAISEEAALNLDPDMFADRFYDGAPGWGHAVESRYIADVRPAKDT